MIRRLTFVLFLLALHAARIAGGVACFLNAYDATHYSWAAVFMWATCSVRLLLQYLPTLAKEVVSVKKL